MKILKLRKKSCLFSLGMDMIYGYQIRSLRVFKVFLPLLGLLASLLLVVTPSFAAESVQSPMAFLEANTNDVLAPISFRPPLSNSIIFLKVDKSSMVNRENTIEGKITDPNFNKMRNSTVPKITAVAWVIGCLSVATLVPLGTWWFFGR